MTRFQILLKETLRVSGCRMSELAAQAHVTLMTVSRSVQYERKIRKNTARDMTEAVIALLNKKIRKRLDEIEQLRRVGNELKAAYIEEFEHDRTEVA